MHNGMFRYSGLIGVAFLVALPHCLVFAAALREEAVAYRIQGYEAQQHGDVARALSYYQKAAALDPTYPTPHNDTGILFEEQGQFEDAERSYQQALALSPNYLEAYANLAMLYERMGQKEKAIDYWMKRYQLGDPSDSWTARAEERLVALGVLKDAPGLIGRRVSRRRIANEALKTYDQSLEEFHALTKEHHDWP